VVAALAVVAFVVNSYVITPLTKSHAELEAEQQRLGQEFERATHMLRRQRLMARELRDMTANGLTRDPLDAESRLLHAIRDWAEETGLSVSSVKPERGKDDTEIGRIDVLVSGTGSMQAVARFLWKAENARLPLRINDLQLGSRKDGMDDLSLQLRLSTLYLAADETTAVPDDSARSGGTP
jgi:Tfp pilus assembly protein PilO